MVKKLRNSIKRKYFFVIAKNNSNPVLLVKQLLDKNDDDLYYIDNYGNINEYNGQDTIVKNIDDNLDENMIKLLKKLFGIEKQKISDKIDAIIDSY